ncbi:hypothetical protein Hanom_Chr00s000540g01648891 [Helianthus anomalus]
MINCIQYCTLRSTLERKRKTDSNSGSLRIVLHLPGPCLTTPALRAASSSGVHLCLGTPIYETPKSFLYFQKKANKKQIQIYKHQKERILYLL